MYSRLEAFLNRFLPFTAEEFSRFRGFFSVRKCKAKEILIRPGETEQYLYFVDTGLLHQYFYKGREMVTTDIISEGTVTGAVVSFLSQAPSHYYLETMEPCVLLALSRTNLEMLYEKYPKWQKLGRVLITYFLLRQERYNLDEVRFSVRERFVHFAEEHSALMLRVPQRRLASYLNIKPETFSRLKPLLRNDRKKIKSHKPAREDEKS